MCSDFGFQEPQWPYLHGGAVSGPTPAGILYGGSTSAGALCLGLLLWDLWAGISCWWLSGSLVGWSLHGLSGSLIRALAHSPPNAITLDIRFQYVDMGRGHKYSVCGSKPQFFHLRNSNCLTCWLIVRTKKKTEEILSISTSGTLNISRYVLLFILPSYLGFLSS